MGDLISLSTAVGKASIAQVSFYFNTTLKTSHMHSHMLPKAVVVCSYGVT